MNRRTGLTALAMLLALGCNEMAPTEAERAAETETAKQPIIGGTLETGYPAVGMLFTGGGAMCTGTLITSKIVLTAGHCTDPSDPPKWFATGPNSDNATETYDVYKAIQHPQYTSSYSSIANDIGLVVLKTAASETPMAYRKASIDSFSGKSILFVGYGLTNVYDDSSSGTKYKVTLTIEDVESKGFWNYTSSSNPKNTCSGDSGGPGFVTTDGVQEVVGVVSYGDEYCSQNGFNTRVDAYASWIATNINTYDPSGTVEPECGNGVCESGETTTTCPSDCTGGSGDLWTSCSASSDCSSELCLQTSDGNFCSEYCSGPDDGTGCPAGFVCVALQDPPASGEGVCYSTGGTATCGNGKCDVGEYYEICAADCVVNGCGTIDDVGCCDSNTLVWCEGSQLYKINCSDTSCGWDTDNGYYNCQTSGGADPSGANPKSCTGGSTGPVCGNGSCETGETTTSCPADCKPATVCGNGTCESGETTTSCPADCKASTVCGNGTCESGETTTSCPADCKTVNLCGNGVCDNGENYDTCGGDCVDVGCGDVSEVGCCDGTVVKWCESSKTKMIDCAAKGCGWNATGAYYDCGMVAKEDTSGLHPRDCGAGSAAVCGNGSCEAGETSSSCPADCSTGGPVCGDGKCESPETTANCAKDCVVSAVVCGDGTCESPETAENCPSDCKAAVCGDGECSDQESSSSCPEDCGKSVTCGDGVCTGEEWCASCPEDCGDCASAAGCSASVGGSGSAAVLVLMLLAAAILGTVRRRGVEW